MHEMNSEQFFIATYIECWYIHGTQFELILKVKTNIKVVIKVDLFIKLYAIE